MAKLNDEHIAQIKSMRADGKKQKEIMDFFKATYGIKLFSAEISRIAHVNKSAKRKYIKHAKPEPIISENREGAITDITAILEEIHGGYKSIFKYLRGELIKSRTQVNTILHGAGLPEINSKIQ